MSEKKLFIDTGDYYKLGHIGWGGTNQQFFGYIEGYKTAADALVEKAIQSKQISILDTFAYPSLFLYRQFIELQLKEIYLLYSDDDSAEKAKFLRKASHNLKKVWLKIKPIIEGCGLSESEDDDILNEVESIIFEFDQFDKSSFTFRYPIKKDLTKVFVEEERVDLSVVKNKMNELYDFLYGVSAMLDEQKQFKSEMRDYYGY